MGPADVGESSRVEKPERTELDLDLDLERDPDPSSLLLLLLLVLPLLVVVLFLAGTLDEVFDGGEALVERALDVGQAPVEGLDQGEDLVLRGEARPVLCLDHEV